MSMTITDIGGFEETSETIQETVGFIKRNKLVPE